MIASPATTQEGWLVTDVSDAARGIYAAAMTVVAALLVVPIWCVRFLPWVDYGDHVARAYMLAFLGQRPDLSKHYEVAWRLLPNLAVDLVLPPLLRVMPTEIAAKAFGTLSVILFVVACHIFGRAVHGRPTWMAAPASFLFYNSLLMYGFVNYQWGVGLFLIAAAAWLSFSRTLSIRAGLLSAAAAFATYVAHITGFTYLGVFAGVTTLYDIWRLRRLQWAHWIALLPLLPPVIIFLAGGRPEKSVVEWSTFSNKVTHLLLTPLSGYALWADLVGFAAIAAVGFLVFRYGRTTMTFPYALSAGVFFALFMVFPTWIQTGSDADTRFLIPACAVAILCLSIRMPFRQTCVAIAIVAFFFAFRTASLITYWRMSDRITSGQLALLEHVPAGHTVYPLVNLPNDRTDRKLCGPLMHVTGYATIATGAISPTMIIVYGQQPLRRRFPLNFDLTPGAVYRPNALSGYDYLWSFNSDGAQRAWLSQRCKLIAAEGRGELYQITATGR